MLRAAPALAFAHLNLRYNPFGELGREERARIAVVPGIELRPGDRVQFVGTSGRGKTTHLLALHAQHAASAYVCIEEGSNACPPVERERTLLVDEAQRLSQRSLERLFARPSALVLGTHHDLGRSAPEALRTFVLEGVSPDKLEAVVRARIEAARRAPGPVPQLDRDAIRALISRYGDDLRAIEGHLYGIFQTLEEPSFVQV